MDNGRIIQLGSRRGFVDAFWEELLRQQRAGGRKTHEQIFEQLDDECQEVFGESRFPSFDAFRKFRDKR